MELRQQTNVLKINTQLATEIKLTKDECKVLRESYAALVDYISILHDSYLEYEQHFENTSEYAIERRDKAYENIKTYTNKLLQKRMSILFYLNIENCEEEEFLDCINGLVNLIVKPNGTAADLGTLQAHGANLCFMLIKNKRQAILCLVETITDQYRNFAPLFEEVSAARWAVGGCQRTRPAISPCFQVTS